MVIRGQTGRCPDWTGCASSLVSLSSISLCSITETYVPALQAVLTPMPAHHFVLFLRGIDRTFMGLVTALTLLPMYPVFLPPPEQGRYIHVSISHTGRSGEPEQGTGYEEIWRLGK